MNPPIEHIRISQQARDQLIKLKRITGIAHWNVLCRWGFCASLAEPSIPQKIKITTDSSVEMSWKVFAGQYPKLMYAVLKQRCVRDGWDCSEEGLAAAFKLHLHRGIGYLSSERKMNSISDLVRKITPDGKNRR